MRTTILKPIAYFDIFNHPLKKEEVANLCGLQPDDEKLSTELEKLAAEKVLYSHNGFFGLQENINHLVKERTEKEARAKQYFKKLPFYVRIIKLFPFVRSISISGSLSKNVMHKNGDIDYFIITQKNRLWICRSFLILFKKIFLLNSRKYFCLNYFIDDNNLEIIDKNIFTAMEVTHLIPVYNKELLDRMKNKNTWIKEFTPDFTHPVHYDSKKGESTVKKFIEFLFKGKHGDYIDLFFMRVTYKRWQKKFKHFDAKKMELTMRSNRGVSKHHPSDFQSKVLKEYKKRLMNLKVTADESFIYS